MPEINSRSNAQVAWLRSLHKPAARRDSGLFLVEGLKEIGFALAAGLSPHSLFTNQGASIDSSIIQRFQAAQHFVLSQQAFERVAYRGRINDNAIAVFERPKLGLDSIKLSDRPFIIVVEALEKPGNLGAILRIADGAGADAVLVSDDSTDIYNPNVIRSSVGTIFSVPIASAPNAAIKQFLDINDIKIFAAALTNDAKLYSTADLSGPVAIVLGAEDKGLSKFWLSTAEQLIIPMKGRNDSLNVASAAAILAYEVLRQRL